MMRYSHTRIKLYNECGMKFKYRYVDKIPSESVGSALHFGRALDEAFNELLTKQDVEASYVKFDEVMCAFRDDATVSYYNGDVAFHLLTDQDRLFLKGKSELLDSAYNMTLKDKSSVVVKLRGCPRVLSELAWLSLYRKGELMIQTYHEQILPLISKVNKVQETLLVQNGEDELTGVVDFIAELTGKTILEKTRYIGEQTIDPSKNYQIVFDNKSASKLYSDEDLLYSEQLNLYNEYYDTNFIGYIVLCKNIPLKGIVNWQILVGDANEDVKNQVFVGIDRVISGVNNQIFQKNKDSCFSYGQRCEYFTLCHGEEKI